MFKQSDHFDRGNGRGKKRSEFEMRALFRTPGVTHIRASCAFIACIVSYYLFLPIYQTNDNGRRLCNRDRDSVDILLGLMTKASKQREKEANVCIRGVQLITVPQTRQTDGKTTIVLFDDNTSSLIAGNLLGRDVSSTSA